MFYGRIPCFWALFFILSACAHSEPFKTEVHQCQLANKSLSEIIARQTKVGIIPEEQTQIFEPQNQNVLAVAVVMHGLNQKPMRMNELSLELAKRGILGVRGVLTGHGGEPDRLKTVTRAEWLTDTHETYCLAEEFATRFHVPLVGVGFSLGGLMISDLATSPEYTGVQFDRVFFLAPALTISWRGKLTRLFSALHFLSIPSANREDNRSSRYTPVPAYNALFDSVYEIQRRGFASIPFSALSFIDPDDELVNAAELERLSKERSGRFPWEFEFITRGPDASIKEYHHILFESRFLGSAAWNRMVSRGVDFLLKKS